MSRDRIKRKTFYACVPFACIDKYIVTLFHFSLFFWFTFSDDLTQGQPDSKHRGQGSHSLVCAATNV